MTWAKGDTELLRDMEPCGGFVGCHPDGQSYVDANALLERAAAHIEALEARVAELEAAVVFQQERVRDEARAKVAGWLHATPPHRTVLVRALRERANRVLTASRRHGPYSHKRREMTGAWVELSALADETERGEWPKEGEGK